MKMFSLSCKDMGVPICNYVAMAETRDEVVKMANDHFLKAHPQRAKEILDQMPEGDLEEKMTENIVEKNEEDL